MSKGAFLYTEGVARGISVYSIFFNISIDSLLKTLWTAILEMACDTGRGYGAGGMHGQRRGMWRAVQHA